MISIVTKLKNLMFYFTYSIRTSNETFRQPNETFHQTNETFAIQKKR